MGVAVIEEPKHMRNIPAEHCCICERTTHTWHPEKDVALCAGCAETATEDEIPTKTEWCQFWEDRYAKTMARPTRMSILT